MHADSSVSPSAVFAQLRQGFEQRELARSLDQLIEEQRFDLHFQPIVDVYRMSILGYEALTRGPADSPLHSPLVLFDFAARMGRLVALEREVIRAAVRRFHDLRLPGQLFLNATADTLTLLGEQRDAERNEFVSRLDGLAPSRIVIELTETRPVLDPVGLQSGLATLRDVGFRIALDDLGEGFASLRRWTELCPDFVKIDRHFIDGVAGDPVKLQFVRSIMEMAASCGSTVIAEGVEQEGDLRVLARMGIGLCQGYLLGRPSVAPRSTLRADLPDLLHRNRAPRDGVEASLPAWGGELCAGQLAHRYPTVVPEVHCADAIAMFREDPQLISIAVVDAQKRPIGLLRSMNVFKRGTERYFDELFGRKSCTELMDPHPLMFDVSASLRQMSEAVVNIDDSHLADGFVVTQNGRYFGSGRMTDLIKAVSDLQLQTARHANPLTLLPGNIAIDRHLDALLCGSTGFTVAYWDISCFKSFNDTYGFSEGDDMIRDCAKVLRNASDAHADFVGHIGGDDFVQVLVGPEWEDRLQRVVTEFDGLAAGRFSPAHLAAGGYPSQDRQGREVFVSLPCLRAGVLCVDPGDFPNGRALATALSGVKNYAKRLPGRSAYFVERRKLSEGLFD